LFKSTENASAAANFLMSMSVGIAMDTIILVPGGGGSRLTPYEEIEILLIPDLRTQELSGSLQFARVVGPEARRFVRYQEQPIVYRGPQITSLRSTIAAPADPGAYRITFSGSHGTSPKTAGGFVVSNPTATRQLQRTRQK
jgi:hypothetical protein